MTAVDPGSAGVAAFARAHPHKARTGLSNGGREATGSNAVKTAQLGQTQELNVKA